MAGQLPGSGSGSSAESSDSDTSSMYTREDVITPEDETERMGFAMDVGEICLGSSPPSSGSALSVSSGHSSPLSVSTSFKLSLKPPFPRSSLTKAQFLVDRAAGRHLDDP